MFTHIQLAKIPYIIYISILPFTYTQSSMCNNVDKSFFANLSSDLVDNFPTYTFLYTIYSLSITNCNLTYYPTLIKFKPYLSTYTLSLITLYFLYKKKDIINEVIY